MRSTEGGAEGPTYDLPTVMTRFLHLGMSLPEVKLFYFRCDVGISFSELHTGARPTASQQRETEPLSQHTVD